MGQVVALDGVLRDPRVWRGRAPEAPARSPHASGIDALDAALPQGGWPPAALTEILLAADGLGEWSLLLPTLAALTQAGRPVVAVAPPYRPYLPALQAKGVRAAQFHVVEAEPVDALWAMEQCLRAGACGAVLGWPLRADDRALRRLQLAAETGGTLAFAFRPLAAAHNASPAALRLALDADAHGPRLRVLKCRGGIAPPRALPYAPAAWA